MEKSIQPQLKLVAFKASKVSLETYQNSSAKEVAQKFDLKLSDILVADNPNWFVKVFHIDLITTAPNLEVASYSVEYHTVFESTLPIDDNFLKSDFARISAPAIGFPYVRAFISNLSLQAGLQLVILPSINFIQLDNLEKQKSAKDERAVTEKP